MDFILEDTIYIMYIVMDNYCKAHNITKDEFLQMDNKHEIIHFVAKCSEFFDSMTKAEMIEEIDAYVART